MVCCSRHVLVAGESCCHGNTKCSCRGRQAAKGEYMSLRIPFRWMSFHISISIYRSIDQLSRNNHMITVSSKNHREKNTNEYRQLCTNIRVTKSIRLRKLFYLSEFYLTCYVINNLDDRILYHNVSTNNCILHGRL